MNCELLKGCVFFNTPQASMEPAVIESLKKTYCNGNPTICARRRVAIAVGREHIPEDLNPNDQHLVVDLVQKALGNK